MANFNFTASAVLQTTGNGRVADGDLPYSGGAISAGDPVYYDVATNSIKAADNSTAAKAAVIGIALNSTAGSGQPVTIATKGLLTVNATMTTGLIYCLANGTAGRWMPSADLDGASAGTYCTVLGTALSTTSLSLNIGVSGAAK